AAYDPRFTPDGKHLLFRAASGKIDAHIAKYELFVAPVDLGMSPRRLDGTAAVRERLTVSADGNVAIAVVSHEPRIKTCAMAIGLRAPFAVKRLACIDGGQSLVDFAVSPKGKWVAFTTTS